ncbi:MAG: hypothetical protein ABL940_02650 [Bacteroidia bacterium]
MENEQKYNLQIISSENTPAEDTPAENTENPALSGASANISNNSIVITPQNFINTVLINELKAVVKISPWLGATCIANGIEFLGKCIDTENPTNWNTRDFSKKNFNAAIDKLTSLSKYRNCRVNLYTEFRCGLVHASVPGCKITLSDKTESHTNLATSPINLNVNDLYNDFKNACEEVINMEFENIPNKMNTPFIYVNPQA